MPHTEQLLDLYRKLGPDLRAELEACANAPGRRILVVSAGAGDRFWAKLAELGWAEAGGLERLRGASARRYTVTSLGAKAIAALLWRLAQSEAGGHPF